QNFNREG
ncbi:unnamed protein product, partial [Allacma fusca]